MKFIYAPAVSFICLFIVSCGGKMYMTLETTQPELKPAPGKALLVIYRPTIIGISVKIDHFLDKNFIGQTTKKSYFITNVDPGIHYIIGVSENNACAKINFEASKVYYLLQHTYWGHIFTQSQYVASDPINFEKVRNKLKYYIYRANDFPTMDESLYKQTINDYEHENTDYYRDISKIKGY